MGSLLGSTEALVMPMAAGLRSSSWRMERLALARPTRPIARRVSARPQGCPMVPRPLRSDFPAAVSPPTQKDACCQSHADDGPPHRRIVCAISSCIKMPRVFCRSGNMRVSAALPSFSS